MHDEANSAAVGDIVEIVYSSSKLDSRMNINFKINQTLKEAEKCINPVNGKMYSM